jgi:hypothetical protein
MIASASNSLPLPNVIRAESEESATWANRQSAQWRLEGRMGPAKSQQKAGVAGAEIDVMDCVEASRQSLLAASI